MKPTQEQIAALVKRLRVSQSLYEKAGVDGLEGVLQAKEAADMLEQLAADILTVCKRESAMIARYDAKLDALERAKPAGIKVLSWGRAEKSGMDLQADCPFGRYYIACRGEYGWMWWRPASTNSHMGIEPSEVAAKAAAQADYEARVLAALEPAPDAPVTVSSTEQDLGALVEHFKAKAEKAYADGVRDAAKVAESYGCCHVPEEIAAAIRTLLTEKDDE